jgi:hypothetical protein
MLIVRIDRVQNPMPFHLRSEFKKPLPRTEYVRMCVPERLSSYSHIHIFTSGFSTQISAQPPLYKLSSIKDILHIHHLGISPPTH